MKKIDEQGYAWAKRDDAKWVKFFFCASKLIYESLLYNIFLHLLPQTR